MNIVIRYVNSIQNLDPRDFAGQFLVTPDGGIYAPNSSDELGGIGSFFKKLGEIALPLAGTIAAPFTGGLSLALIGAGGAIGGGLLAKSDAGQAGQAKGLQQITDAGHQVMVALDKIETDPTMLKADKIANAQKLVAALSDPNVFYQAKNGADAAALENFKTAGATYLKEIQALPDVAQQQTALQTTTGASGQIVQTVDANGNIVQTVQPLTTTGLPFGLTTTELIFGGIAVYFLFFRN